MYKIVNRLYDCISNNEVLRGISFFRRDIFKFQTLKRIHIGCKNGKKHIMLNSGKKLFSRHHDSNRNQLRGTLVGCLKPEGQAQPSEQQSPKNSDQQCVEYSTSDTYSYW